MENAPDLGNVVSIAISSRSPTPVDNQNNRTSSNSLRDIQAQGPIAHFVGLNSGTSNATSPLARLSSSSHNGDTKVIIADQFGSGEKLTFSGKRTNSTNSKNKLFNGNVYNETPQFPKSDSEELYTKIETNGKNESDSLLSDLPTLPPTRPKLTSRFLASESSSENIQQNGTYREVPNSESSPKNLSSNTEFTEVTSIPCGSELIEQQTEKAKAKLGKFRNSPGRC